MPGSTAGSTPLGRFSSSSSADTVHTSDFSTYRSKGRELAQAMLSEIEDLLRGFDADLKTLSSSKSSSVCQRSWSDAPSQPVDLNSSSSLESCPLPSRSRVSWGLADSHIWRLSSSAVQTLSDEGDEEGSAFMTLIRNIYKMVSSDIAPKLHGVTQEVTELRKSNELLTEKVEQQRLRNDTLLEEYEDLQSELRAKDTQLREQRRVSKNLGMYQGENAMLKVELDSLRVRVEKLGGGSNSARPAVREVQKKTDVPCKRASSNEWLSKENEELQREVARWRTETSEKEVLINELKDVIKNLTVAETPRSPVQRKLSTARPESMLGAATMGANRAFSDAASLDPQVGPALTLETPRGRLRNSLMGRLSPFPSSKRSPSATTLAQDLRISPAAPTDSAKVQATAVSDEQPNSRTRDCAPEPPRAEVTVVDAADTAAGFGGINAAPREGVGHWVEAIYEAMERALFEVEDIRASRIKDAEAWECSKTNMKQQLTRTEEKLRAATAEAQTLTSERDAALVDQGETQKKLDEVTRQLQESISEVAELKETLERTERTMEAAHKEAAAAQLQLTQALATAEKQIAGLQDMVAFRNGLIMSVVCNTIDLLPKRHLQADESTGDSDVQVLGTSGAEPPLKRPSTGSTADDKYEGVAEGCRCPLQFCGSKQLMQRPDVTSSGQKLKVVFKTPDDACCSTSGCLKLWCNSGATAKRNLHNRWSPFSRRKT